MKTHKTKVPILLFSIITAISSHAQMHDMDNMTMMMPVTKAERLLTVLSNESKRSQLNLARAEGDSVDNCTNWIKTQAGTEGGQIHAGEYKITYAIGAPEGWYNYNENAVK